MNTTTTPPTRPWAPAPATSTPRRTGLWLACLSSALTLLAPTASAAVSLTPTVDEPECVVMSGSWSSGAVPYSDYVFVKGPEGFAVWIDGSANSVGFGALLSLLSPSFFVQYHFYSNPFGSPQAGSVDDFSYAISAVFNKEDSSWTGTYKITDVNCEPTHGVPEGGSALALFACGLGAVGAGRRFLIKKRA